MVFDILPECLKFYTIFMFLSLLISLFMKITKFDFDKSENFIKFSKFYYALSLILLFILNRKFALNDILIPALFFMHTTIFYAIFMKNRKYFYLYFIFIAFCAIVSFFITDFLKGLKDYNSSYPFWDYDEITGSFTFDYIYIYICSFLLIAQIFFIIIFLVVFIFTKLLKKWLYIK